MLVFVLNQAQKANTGKIQTPVYENVREFGYFPPFGFALSGVRKRREVFLSFSGGVLWVNFLQGIHARISEVLDAFNRSATTGNRRKVGDAVA